jgi:hypothetical protein
MVYADAIIVHVNCVTWKTFCEKYADTISPFNTVTIYIELRIYLASYGHIETALFDKLHRN